MYKRQDLQIVKIDGVHEIILIKPGLAVSLELSDRGVQPDGLAEVKEMCIRDRLMPGRVMVLLVCTGAVLGFLGIYQPFAEFAGGGASVPLLGFGNTLWNGVKAALSLIHI